MQRLELADYFDHTTPRKAEVGAGSSAPTCNSLAVVLYAIRYSFVERLGRALLFIVVRRVVHSLD